MTRVKTGQNVIMAARLLLFPEQEDDLTIEVKNSNFKFRFLTGYFNPTDLPAADQIDVTAITIRRPGDADDTRLLQGGPINLKMILNDAQLANGPFLLEALDEAVRNTEVIFTLRNNDPVQAVQVDIALVGEFAQIPTRPEDRGEIEQPRRQRVEPQQGPLQGVDVRQEQPASGAYY